MSTIQSIKKPPEISQKETQPKNMKSSRELISGSGETLFEKCN
jgi:hypothetical protein